MIHRKPELLHSLFSFPATESRINQHGFHVIAHIIAVGIAA